MADPEPKPKPKLEKARFGPANSQDPAQIDPNGEVSVHFNPTSLQTTISNTLQTKKRGKAQYVSQSVAKLTLDLLFDSTDTGEDVRKETAKIVKLMEPDEQNMPRLATFIWGAYRFSGLIESYKETLEYFHISGVPLRASVNLTLSQQDKVFDDVKTSDVDKDAASDLELDKLDMPAPGGAAGGNPGGSASDVAARGNDPAAARAIAAQNGHESLRFPSGPLTVDPSIQLGPPAAFASAAASASAGASLSAGAGAGLSAGASAGLSAGAGASLSAGAGAGLSAGAGAGLSAGAGASLSAGAGAGLSAGAGASLSAGASAGVSAQAGGSLSAGVAAVDGAFGGLQTSVQRHRSAKIDVAQLAPVSAAAGVFTSAGASFEAGGKATAGASAGLSADVGASASLQSLIEFEEET